MSRLGPTAALVAFAATADPARIGRRLNRLASYGTIDHVASRTSTSAATLSPRVTDDNEPCARIAYTMATRTSTAQPASWVRSSAPNEDSPGETCPCAKKAMTSADATIAP